MNFVNKTYWLKKLPHKKQYIFNRIKKIYPKIDDEVVNRIINAITIKFREQEEKGASNHKKFEIYITLREIDRYKLKNERDFIRYLDGPESVIIHESMHIFQNTLKSLPEKEYLYAEDGKSKIDYDKYITDHGEIQARIEQIIEMLNWGFDKNEIVNFLYSRKHDDQDLWKMLVDKAEKLRKTSSSKVPNDIDDNVDSEQGRLPATYNLKNRGNNYEKDYLSSGTLSDI